MYQSTLNRDQKLKKDDTTKIEHNFLQDIKMSLHSSCRDIVVKNFVNIMCKDGFVSCDPTMLA